MTSAHTPGPWIVSWADQTFARIDAKMPDGGYPDRHVTVAQKMHLEDAERATACVNACADINPAAVPALLEACQAALRYMLDDKGSDVTGAMAMNKLIAAIAQATGQQERSAK